MWTMDKDFLDFQGRRVKNNCGKLVIDGSGGKTILQGGNIIRYISGIVQQAQTFGIVGQPIFNMVSEPRLIGSDPESLRWNVQAELVHCRWAMLGAAGIFIPEFLTKIGILNTPSWYTAGEAEYFTDTTTLFVVELVLIGWAEGRRWADIIKPGCVNTDPIFPNNKLTGTDVGYPGGFWFDPLGYGSGSPEKLKELRTKEIKNGRLAMLAVMGAWFQHIYTGTGPIDNLFAHLADPGHATVFAAFAPK